jgi:hypothetical protein
MTHRYSGLLAFYGAFKEPKHFVSIEDIDALAAELRKTANVWIGADGSVTVSERSAKHGPQKKYCREHYTKLSAAVPRGLAAEFSAACKALGVSQMSVLAPLLAETIAKSKATARGGENVFAGEGRDGR